MIDPKLQNEPSETPEDVATLYSWANLHGAKYRDFSATRAQAREEARRRVEDALAAEEKRRQEEAERQAEEERQIAARQAAEAAEAARRAEAERLAEIARQAEAERQAVLAAQQAQRQAALQRTWQPPSAESSQAAQPAASRLEGPSSPENATGAPYVSGPGTSSILSSSAPLPVTAGSYPGQTSSTAASVGQPPVPSSLPPSYLTPPPSRPSKSSTQYPAQSSPGQPYSNSAGDSGYGQGYNSPYPPASGSYPEYPAPEYPAPSFAYPESGQDPYATGGWPAAEHRDTPSQPAWLAEPELAAPVPPMPPAQFVYPAHLPQLPQSQPAREPYPAHPYGQPASYPQTVEYPTASQRTPNAYPSLYSGQDTGQYPVAAEAGPSGYPQQGQPAPASSSAPTPVDDTLVGNRDRIASRWFALKHVFDPNSPAQPEQVPAQPAVRPPVLAVFSLAGGVGKTSLVAALGRALSSRGEKILLVDTASFGLLPFFFGARDQRPGMLRTFNPPGVSTDAPIQLVTLDPEGQAAEAAGPEWLMQEVGRYSRGASRIVLDLPTASGAITRRALKLAPAVLVPVVPDMNSVVSVGAIEAFFRHSNANGGSKTMPYYVLNQFDYSIPLHLDVREILREQIGDRLLPFALRRSPQVSEALAEGMTVMDYAPTAVVAEDYASLAGWVRSLSAPATVGYRGVRWSER